MIYRPAAEWAICDRTGMFITISPPTDLHPYWVWHVSIGSPSCEGECTWSGSAETKEVARKRAETFIKVHAWTPERVRDLVGYVLGKLRGNDSYNVG